MRAENARLGVETTTRCDHIARSATSPDIAGQPVSGTWPALIEAGWKKPSRWSKDWERFTQGQNSSSPWIISMGQRHDRLGVAGVGAARQIRGQPVTVGAVTDGIRSFTTTPYVFSGIGGARSYIGLPDAFTSYFLVRLKSKGNIERIGHDILANLSGIQALTPDQFRDQSRSFWLSGTGAGTALFAVALLSFIVGTATVAQTLYSNTKEHLFEFATLRAIGAPNSYIYKVIIAQALLNAFAGFAITGTIGIAVVRFTAKSALPVVITPNLMIELFLLTVVMCIASAFAAILRVVRVDPAIVLTQ